MQNAGGRNLVRGREAALKGDRAQVEAVVLLDERGMHGDAERAAGFIAGEQACGRNGGGALIVVRQVVAVDVRGLRKAGEEHQQDGRDRDQAHPQRVDRPGAGGLEQRLQVR